MSISPSKVLAIEICLPIIALPFVIWLALYVIGRCSSTNLRPVLAWLKGLRWVTWIAAILLLFFSMAREHFPMTYGLAMLSFSAGHPAHKVG
jgi:hypothetical protein